ncbi:Uncharacterized conserved protein YloU, alkaline shock protein (Asp23) family [Quadrisphaera granulorum]|uniref:Putative alkaline shock family protein YloU n=1 Tax=Quadrisphaera granulorum TaxID=317664 RepID=A0A316A5D8_9ACTN|nr:Asp23/Gls24 family envelope stress response protein [Quadrisphaera granulorum]PWJ53126.1 putative alkaline shock family protein YloU [Quadrisphaera granulorum]SZE97058.1 Uncharacterized conserved protein YloU, alkaline shock protein (Asp23) family [Quadrisphaera granulorum]
MTDLSAPSAPVTTTPADVRVAGATTTTDDVIATVAGLAARDVPGVHDLGTRTQRALGTVGQLVPGPSWAGPPGVQVQVGEREALVEVSVVTELGCNAPEVAAHVRRAVTTALRDLVGLEVTAVDVEISDVTEVAGVVDVADVAGLAGSGRAT